MQSTIGTRENRTLSIEGIQRIAAANGETDRFTNISVDRRPAGTGHVGGGRETEGMGLGAERSFRIEMEPSGSSSAGPMWKRSQGK